MEFFLLLIGAILVIGAFWDATSWIDNWFTDRRIAKLTAKEAIANDKLYAESQREHARIESLPNPWIGMDEDDLQNCNWHINYHTDCLETINELGIERKYYYQFRGYLIFRNKKLIEIQRNVY